MSDLELSVTGLSRDRGCQRAVAFAFRAGLRRRSSNANLAIGSAFHEYAATYYSTGDTQAGYDKAMKTYRESAPTDMEESEFETGEEMVSSLCTCYPALATMKDVDEQLQPLGVEQVFRVPLGGAYLIGRVDLYAGTKWGHAMVDHKTAKSARASYFYGFRHDPQNVLYCYATRALNLPIKLFGLNVIAKTASPYLSREYFPVDWKYVDWAVDHLKRVIDDWLEFPEDAGGIVDQVKANPCHCRNCAFTDICHLPRSKAAWVAENYFEKADHSAFRKGVEDDD